MGIIMLVMGKIKPVQIIFYLAAAIVFIVYTPLLLKYRSKKQVKRIERYHVPNEMTFNDEGIQVEFADKKETYEWEQIQKVVTTPKTIGFYYETEKELIVPKPDFGDSLLCGGENVTGKTESYITESNRKWKSKSYGFEP